MPKMLVALWMAMLLQVTAVSDRFPNGVSANSAVPNVHSRLMRPKSGRAMMEVNADGVAFQFADDDQLVDEIVEGPLEVDVSPQEEGEDLATVGEDEEAGDEDTEVAGASSKGVVNGGVRLMRKNWGALNVSGIAGERYPSEIMKCPSSKGAFQADHSCGRYAAVVKSVHGVLDKVSSTCDRQNNNCPQGDVTGCFLRFAGHDLMDFRAQARVGGADGCLDFKDPDNSGLAECLHLGDNGAHLLQAYVDHCHRVSLADFVVIAAEAVMDWTRSKHIQEVDAGAPKFDFASHFQFGRQTTKECPKGDNADKGEIPALPGADAGCSEVSRVFIDGMGLSWKEAAALMSVHSLGRAQAKFSGFDGWWSSIENQRRFNTDYYWRIISHGWIPGKSSKGKDQWVLADKARNTQGDFKMMMLDTDICLFWGATFQGGDMSAKKISQNGRGGCCTWTIQSQFSDAVRKHGTFCGTDPSGNTGIGQAHADCCDHGPGGASARAPDCDSFSNPRTGPAATEVAEFARNDAAWVESFQATWTKVTEQGHTGLEKCGASPPTPPPAFKVRLSVHTHATIRHADSNGDIRVKFDDDTRFGNNGWQQIDNPHRDDFEHGRTDEFELKSPSAQPSKITIRNTGSDGWCFDEIKVGDVYFLHGIPQWIDNPIERNYKGDYYQETVKTEVTLTPLECSPGQARQLADFSSLSAMQTNGWTMLRFNDGLQYNGGNFRGWCGGRCVASMEATLKGRGKLSLTVANEHSWDHSSDNYVRVLKNNAEIARLGRGQEKTVKVNFNSNDKVKIDEKFGIIRVKGLSFACQSGPRPSAARVCDLQHLYGETFWVRGWSAAQRKYYCYKLVIGKHIWQSETHGARNNAECKARMRRTYYLGDYKVDHADSRGPDKHYYAASRSQGGRQTRLKVAENNRAKSITADVSEPRVKQYVVDIKGPPGCEFWIDDFAEIDN